MPKPIDATLKDLLEAGPADWLAWLGLPGAPQVEAMDTDVSTVTAAADKVIRVGAVPPWLLHLEFQAHWEAGVPQRLHLYNTLLFDRWKMPVHSILVLLRRGANASDMTGTWEQHRADGRRYLEFQYDVVRVWQQPVESLLTGGVAMVPLAPLSDEAEPILPQVVQRMQQRLVGVAPEQKAKLWTSAYVLMGLRYPEELTDQVLQGVLAMEESVTYQAIIRRGRIQEARNLLLRQGRIRWGDPTPSAEASIQTITDLERLEQLSERLLVVSSWQELLTNP
jgi:predicted transposase YdaD